MNALFIGKGKLAHHQNCGMIIAANNNNKTIKTVVFNGNMSTCKQCRHHFNDEINKMSIGIQTVSVQIEEKPTFRLAVISPYQLEELNIERMNKLLAIKRETHNIRIGIPRKGVDKPFHFAMDQYCHENGFQLVCRDALKGQYPTELNQWLMEKADAVIIYTDGDWFYKRAIRWCEDNHKPFVKMEI